MRGKKGEKGESGNAGQKTTTFFVMELVKAVTSHEKEREGREKLLVIREGTPAIDRTN